MAVRSIIGPPGQPVDCTSSVWRGIHSQRLKCMFSLSIAEARLPCNMLSLFWDSNVDQKTWWLRFDCSSGHTTRIACTNLDLYRTARFGQNSWWRLAIRLSILHSWGFPLPASQYPVEVKFVYPTGCPQSGLWASCASFSCPQNAILALQSLLL